MSCEFCVEERDNLEITNERETAVYKMFLSNVKRLKSKEIPSAEKEFNALCSLRFLTKSPELEKKISAARNKIFKFREDLWRFERAMLGVEEVLIPTWQAIDKMEREVCWTCRTA